MALQEFLCLPQVRMSSLAMEVPHIDDTELSRWLFKMNATSLFRLDLSASKVGG